MSNNTYLQHFFSWGESSGRRRLGCLNHLYWRRRAVWSHLEANPSKYRNQSCTQHNIEVLREGTPVSPVYVALCVSLPCVSTFIREYGDSATTITVSRIMGLSLHRDILLSNLLLFYTHMVKFTFLKQIIVTCK